VRHERILLAVRRRLVMLTLACAAAVAAPCADAADSLCSDGGGGSAGTSLPVASGPWIGAMTVGIGEWARSPMPDNGNGVVVVRPPTAGSIAASTGPLVVSALGQANADDALPQPAIIYAPGAQPRGAAPRIPTNIALAAPSPPPASALVDPGISSGLSTLPVAGARVTSGFGWRIHPILGVRRFHYGVDLGAPRGTPVRAPAGGTVAACGREGAAGLFVRLRHDDHIVTLYAHLDRFAELLHQGQAVPAGDVIAYVGSTGLSTGPHLYYEIRIDGRAIDPMKQEIEAEEPAPYLVNGQIASGPRPRSRRGAARRRARTSRPRRNPSSC
jgi:murein DD-endopeptidase MepM/ murein hydrolase activator NlpD